MNHLSSERRTALKQMMMNSEGITPIVKLNLNFNVKVKFEPELLLDQEQPKQQGKLTEIINK